MPKLKMFWDTPRFSTQPTGFKIIMMKLILKKMMKAESRDFLPTFFRKSLDRNQLLTFLRSSPKVKHIKIYMTKIMILVQVKFHQFCFKIISFLNCGCGKLGKTRGFFQMRISQAILPENVRNPPQQQHQTRPFTGCKTAGQGVLFTDSLKPEPLASLEAAYSRLQVSFLPK